MLTSWLSKAYAKDPLRLIVLGGLGFFTIIATGLLLFHSPLPLSKQPFPDAHEYLNAANRLAHGQGYTTTVRDYPYSPHIHQVTNPPRFPPGTSLLLAPFALVGSYPGNVEFGVRLIAIALVVVTGWAALSIGGWYAALLAALITATSEFVLLNTRIVMSDALAALLIVVCVPLMRLQTERRWSIYLLGFLCGYGLVIRESGIVVIATLLIVLSGWDRVRAAVGAVPPALGLAIYNWSTFGAPWRTGQSYWLGDFHLYSLANVMKHPWPPGGEEGSYADSLRIFDLIAHTHAGFISLAPNIWFYPLIILGFSTVFGPPWFTLVGLVAAVCQWSKREARFTVLLTVLMVIFYMPNFGQDPRYLAGPCILLTVWASTAVVQVAGRIRSKYGQQISAFLSPKNTRGAMEQVL